MINIPMSEIAIKTIFFFVGAMVSAISLSYFKFTKSTHTQSVK